jgi:hypothetical protein
LQSTRRAIANVSGAEYINLCWEKLCFQILNKVIYHLQKDNLSS